MLNLNKNEMEWVCKHLGHSDNVHKTHYRQMSGFIERVHCTKMLLLQDMNQTNKFKGKRLEEIDISDIVFPGHAEENRISEVDEEELDDEINELFPQDESEYGFDESIFVQKAVESTDEEEAEEIAAPRKKEKQKVTRQKWNEIGVNELKKYFKSYLDLSICPRTADVNSAKKKVVFHLTD